MTSKDDDTLFFIVLGALLILVTLAFKIAQIGDGCEAKCAATGAKYQDWHMAGLMAIMCECTPKK